MKTTRREEEREERENHYQDSDCTVVEGECVVCGVGHDGDPCRSCGGLAFHRDLCPEESELLSPHAHAQFPKRCTACGVVYEGPEDYHNLTFPPTRGRSLAVLGGVHAWVRNCACGGTMVIELEVPHDEA